MSLLEVIALHAADAERAEAGGADRIELLGTMDDDGLSPEPRNVDKTRRATSIQIRPMVRLRAGFGTDGGEVTRLKGLIAAYQDAGADVLYAPGLTSAAQIRAVVEAVDRPVNVVMGLGGTTLSVAELGELGVRRISVGSAMARAAYGVLIRAAEEIVGAGTFTFAAEAVPYATLQQHLTSATS